jgi:outer membrane biogenesis lipoprotein LolB
MMNRLRLLILMLTAVLLFGCGADDKVEQQADLSDAQSHPAEESSKKTSGVVPQYQLDALERAGNAEALLLKADEERRKALEQ